MPIVGRHEGHRFPGVVPAGGAADAVDVVPRVVGNVEVDDVPDPADVQPSRRHVRRNQHPRFSRAEALQAPITQTLGLAAVKVVDRDAARIEILGEIARRVPSPGKDQHLAGSPLLEEMEQQLVLRRPIHGVNHLADALGRRLEPHFDAHGIFHHLVSEPEDPTRHGGREEQRLPGPGGRTDDSFHLVDEPHVQHAVGLVQHQNLHLREVRRASAHVVEEPAGCGDEHVAAVAELLRLTSDARPAVHDHALHIGGDRISLDRGANLLRELPRRGDDESPGTAVNGVLAQTLNHRKRERRGLSRPRVGCCQQVPALQSRRDGLALDLRGPGVARPQHGLQQPRRQTQFGEGRVVVMCFQVDNR